MIDHSQTGLLRLTQALPVTADDLHAIETSRHFRFD